MPATAFFDVARMHKDISFIPLLHMLQHSGGLQDGSIISAGEKIFIFLYMYFAEILCAIPNLDGNILHQRFQRLFMKL